MNARLLIALAAVALGTGAPSVLKSAEPPVATMKRASQAPHGKTGAPVEVRYEPTGTTLRGQPITLKLAFVPQITGAAMAVEFPASDAVTIDTVVTRFSVAKAERDGVYRRSLTVTPRLADSAEVRVMVWVEAEGARYFSIFTVPVGK